MELREVFEQRRSVNFFDPAKEVDESLIRQIFDLAKLAPSSFNLQPWKIILVHDPEWKAKLRECANGQPKVTEAPYIAIMLGDKKAYEKMGELLAEPIAKGLMKPEMADVYINMAKGLYSGENDRAFAGRNVGLFAMAFMLAAKSLGVDTHPMDGFSADAIRKTFSVPDEYDIVMLIAIGHHDGAKELTPRAGRRPFDQVVVKESF